MMRYRDIEYTVVQGIGVWKWSASVTGVVINGHAAIKSEAVVAAEKAGARSEKRAAHPARRQRLTAANAIEI